MPKGTTQKSRWFQGLLYPESMPEDCFAQMELTAVKIAVSPLHDKDRYESGEHKGELKKMHYHVLIQWSNTTTLSAVRKVFEPLGVVGLTAVHSPEGFYDYLTHKNNPEKAQYNLEEIWHCNGFRKPEDKQQQRQDCFDKIFQIIESAKPTNLLSLVRYCRNDAELMSEIKANAYFYKEILYCNRVDIETRS